MRLDRVVVPSPSLNDDTNFPQTVDVEQFDRLADGSHLGYLNADILVGSDKADLSTNTSYLDIANQCPQSWPILRRIDDRKPRNNGDWR